jgi:hypothetical protein
LSEHPISSIEDATAFVFFVVVRHIYPADRPMRPMLNETRFGERVLQHVEFRLHLRDPSELDLLLPDDLIQDLAPLVQEVDERVQFLAPNVDAA